ncbi:SDR family NAD(P)-dependent oxidoreductase [Roseimarinus sediminis]|jgi:NAD(P)-dependent dehydrogenase (short-subunit alcohol dehydrogenase family)|uniref:SDR family NAD(P)-dependent oxidoreductase n=1 Tax=Roseimarinus sediminis TaxID=1610899 RepID=UPI003D1F0726
MKVLITGTHSGLGFGLARYYLKQGAEVYGISRKQNPELADHASFRYLSLDLIELGQIEALLPAFISELKSLDLVILNAGKLNEIKDLKDTSIAEIKSVMDLNVWSNKVLIDTLTTYCSIGQVVAVSSGASVSGARGWNAYALSKATLNMLINLYAGELENTHFCALAPGLVDTGMQEYIAGIQETEKYPVLKKLQTARGTQKMPGIHQAAALFARAVTEVRNYKSGSFLDVRELK